MSLLRSLVLVFVLAAAAFAADATGVWSGEVKLPNGQSLPFIARLTQKGDTVTGKLDGINGAPDVEIVNGKVAGDTVTFSGIRQINGAAVKFNYIGKISAESIDFQILRDDGSQAPLASLTRRQK